MRLVEAAKANDSPFVRLADRYALAFLVVSVGVAGAAWAVSGELGRAVAVLVVATPCPLILAAPVAIVAGLSRAARRGVVVKGGGHWNSWPSGEILLFDKTGTLTAGRPALRRHRHRDDMAAERHARACGSRSTRCRPTSWPPPSSGPAATAGSASTCPTDVEEVPGHGIRGTVGRARSWRSARRAGSAASATSRG